MIYESDCSSQLSMKNENQNYNKYYLNIIEIINNPNNFIQKITIITLKIIIYAHDKIVSIFQNSRLMTSSGDTDSHVRS